MVKYLKMFIFQRLLGATLLVFANKQDLHGALSADEIKEVFLNHLCSFSFTTYFIIHWSTNKRTSCGPNIILTLILRRHLFLFLSCILLSPLCTNCDHKVPLLAEKYLNWYLLSYFPIVLAVDISFSHSIVHFGLINNSVQIGPRILPTYLFFTNQK